jgi:hypothetical protein
LEEKLALYNEPIGVSLANCSFPETQINVHYLKAGSL